ncbi:phosphoinositide phospholipase C [Malassezia cuniculi]|uniref:Phosphoinositide phospholipase C n=1 Tax=Malassezia cuniculi TaxID=948313 RepID=A0AAF0EQZ7_9BASI|nr:phosphoinositide phospholipase C [Malassezia cuniculi]
MASRGAADVSPGGGHAPAQSLRRSSSSDSSTSWSSQSSFSRSIAGPIQSLHARYREWKRATSDYKSMRDGTDGSGTEGEHSVGAGGSDAADSVSAHDYTRSGSGVPSPGNFGGIFFMEEAEHVPPEPSEHAEALSLTRIVPEELRAGEPMLKVTQNKVMQRVFVLDPISACIEWDSKKHNSVPLSSIREVRVGADAATYRMSLSIPPTHEPRWISVVYQTANAYKALHLVALSDASMARWSAALLQVQAQRQALLSGRLPAAHAQSQWLAHGWPKHGALGLDAVAQLCARIGVQVSMPELAAIYHSAGGAGPLDFDAFERFVAALKRRPEIDAVYAALGGREALDRPAFAAFLRTVQGEVWSDAHVERVYQTYADPATGRMSLEGLSSFLTSLDNAAVRADAPQRRGSNTAARIHAFTAEALLATSGGAIAAPMAHPLSDYFICSSHNTYLVGGQWKGDSTVEGYVRALQQGVRSVELDCWNGSNGPQVTHGRTLTSAVPFVDVVKAVARYAFVASPYPLILSLEVHCDVAQQEIMAAVLRDKLGDALVTAPLEHSHHQLPSPDALRGRILVKAKDWNLIRASSPAPAPTPRETDSESDTTLLAQAKSLVRQMRTNEDAPLMAPSLTSLLVYTVGVRCRGINKKEQYLPEHIFSLSERKANRMLLIGAYDLAKHNLTHLTRVYPSMASIDRVHRSANFSPINYWAAGCQLVALNWQTHDLGFEINQALFAGSQGYVLKPRALRLRTALKDSGKYVRVAINLGIISAQQLPLARPPEAVSPYVQVTVRVPDQWKRAPVVDIGAYSTALPQVLAQQLEQIRRAHDESEHGTDNVSQTTPLADAPNNMTGRIQPDSSPLHVPFEHMSVADSGGPSGGPSSHSSSDTLAKSVDSEPHILQSSPTTFQTTTTTTSSSASPPLLALPSTQGAAASRPKNSTQTVPHNGLAPVWNTQCTLTIDIPAGRTPPESDEIRCLTRGLLDLCFIRFQVVDERTGTALGSSTVSIGHLAHGLRHLPLHDAQLTPLLYSTLLVHTAYASAAIVD